MAEYTDIPIHGRSITVIRSVVRKQDLQEFIAPHVTKNCNDILEITNCNSDLIGDDCNVDIDYLQSTVYPSEETDIDQELYPIIEEPFNDPISPEIHPLLLPEVSEECIIRPTLDVAHTALPSSGNHPEVTTVYKDEFEDNTMPNIISQDSYDSAEDELDPTADTQHISPSITDDVNAALDENFEPAEIASIITHQFNGGVLEFQCKYDSGDIAWHPFDLVKADDPWSVANYVLHNYLGLYANNVYRRWAHLFLCTIKCVTHRMKPSNVFSIYASTYHPTPKNYVLVVL